MKHVIIGAGPAGVFAAKSLREQDKDCEIFIITEEPYPLYARPKLPDFISGTASIENLIVFKKDWYEKQNIQVKKNVKIVDINPRAKEIILLHGEKLFYDKLLFATGGMPRIPPVAIRDNKNVLVLRTIGNAEEIKKREKSDRKAVVVGGGLLGLEAASALTGMGLEVNVLEFSNHLLPKQMDKESGDYLKSLLKKKNLNIYVSCKSKIVEANRIILEDDREFEFEFMLFSTGIEPNTELAKKIGIKARRGIVVDDNMQTNIEDIYAAGDCAEHNGRVYGLWSPAMEQGKIAAENMTGKKTGYAGSRVSSTTKVAGIEIASIGDISKLALEATEARTECSSENFHERKPDAHETFKCLYKNIEDKTVSSFVKQNDSEYAKIYMENGIIIFAVLIGNINKANVIKKVMKDRETIKNVEEIV